jgi:hypothetical protein
VASLVFGTGGLGDAAGGLQLPLALPAPTGLDWPHAENEGSALVLGFAPGFGSRHGVFPSLSSVYKSTIFLLLYRQTIELLRSLSFALNTFWHC